MLRISQLIILGMQELEGEKNIEEMDVDEPDYKTIANNMQYKDAKEARLHHDMLELARRFIENDQYPDYEKLSDLKNSE